jgi:hypothetical protein
MTAIRSSWEPVADFDAALEPPEPPSILTGPDGALFYTAKRHLLWGASESMKSWIALAAVAEVINGDLAAVYVDADDMGLAAVMERLVELGVGDEKIRKNLLFIQPEERFDSAADYVIDRVASERPIALCVIDAMQPAMRLQGLSGNVSDEVQDWVLQVVGAFQRRGIATITIDHVVKNAEVGRYSFGAERKLSGLDVSISCEAVGAPMTRSNPQGTVKLKAAKDRPGWHERGDDRVIGEFVMDLERTPKWVLKLDPEGRAKGKTEDMALRVGQVLGQNPTVTQTRCAEILGVKRDSGTFRRGWAMARATFNPGPGGPPPSLYKEGGPAHPTLIPIDGGVA